MSPKKRTGDPEMGQRIKALREAKRWEQADLGARIDPPVGQRTISTWETGAIDVSTAQIRQLTKILETTTAYLYGETDNPSTPAARLRRAGINPGNLLELEDETLEMLVVDIVEQLRARRLGPPPGQGEPHDAGDHPASSAGGN